MNPLLRTLLMFLMRKEAEEAGRLAEAKFKSDLFITDPQRYQNLYENDEPDYEIEEEIPETEAEFEAMIREMGRAGLIDP